MSELSRRRKADALPTVTCFCEACERVLYVPQDSLFCPVCSSAVIPTDGLEAITVEAS